MGCKDGCIEGERPIEVNCRPMKANCRTSLLDNKYELQRVVSGTIA